MEIPKRIRKQADDFYEAYDNSDYVVDTKGYRTEVYKLKKKVFMKKYGIEIEEV